ncbi:MAG: substrate-binding domain-containing protein [Oscillospiraceae bacterium]|jgi:phosphate transport system substrate-binding protein|nr:substrate-binding domain-containing protein [Oscillospiraceae bacterium]
MKKLCRALCALLLLCLPMAALGESQGEAFSPDLWHHIDGSTSLIPLSEALLSQVSGLTQQQVTARVQHHTTADAYQALLSDPATRLIFVTPPSADELHSATVNGTALELVPIAREALVFVVNAENSVGSLSVQELQHIYQGEIDNWNQVGGANLPILPYQRSMNSGSQTLFQQVLMGDLEPMVLLQSLEATTMSFLVDAVSAYDNNEGALGYSVYYYIDQMYGNDRLRMLSVDGVAPTRETIADGSYPLCTYYYAVMRADLPEDAPERALVRYLLSDEGQRVVESAGYVPLTPQGMPKAPADARTSQSTGTGGTALRTGEAVVHTIEQYGDGGMPGDPQLEALIHQWRKDNGHEAFQQRTMQSGNLFSLYDYHHTAAAVFDLKAGKQLALSDLFYDGINYIDLINRYIAENMDEALDRYGFEYAITSYRFEMVTEQGETVEIRGEGDLREDIAKRPFAGFPSDYPLFLVEDGWLHLLVNRDNPYFVSTFPGYSTAYLSFPLTPDISPFGRRHIRMTWAGETVGRHKAALASIQIAYDGSTAVADKINETLRTIDPKVVADTAAMDAALTGTAYGSYDHVLILSEMFYGENTLGLCYAAMDQGDGGPYYSLDCYVTWGGIFNLETGELLDVAVLASAHAQDADVQYYEESAQPGEKSQPLAGYALPETWQVSDAWYAYGRWGEGHGQYLNIRIEEPSGRRVRMLIPMAEWP